MQALWSVSQIQGKRDYQEDVFAAVESDCIFYAGEQYPLENGVLPAQYTLLVIADGMGGMGHGDIAASIIVESFIECFLNVFNQKIVWKRALVKHWSQRILPSQTKLEKTLNLMVWGLR
jgi:hypothetical protein